MMPDTAETPAPYKPGKAAAKRERYRELWFAGVPAEEIARIMRTSSENVYQISKRNGWPPRRRIVRYEVVS